MQPNVSKIKPTHEEKMAKNMNAIRTRNMTRISLLAQFRSTFFLIKNKNHKF
jgi:hypothetical protein